MATSRASTAHLTANGISLRFADGERLFEELTFGVGDERIGLVGSNGSGKSTLLAVLAGAVAPTTGRVHATTPVAYLAQRAEESDDATVARMMGVDVVLAAIARSAQGRATVDDLLLIGDDWLLPDRTSAALASVGLGHLSLERSARSLSGGEQTCVRLAALLLDDPRLLLLDEPTNHLDRKNRAAVHELVAAWPHGLIVASHDRELLERVDRIFELSGGSVRSYGGNYSAFLEQREREQLAAEAERDSAAAELSRTRKKLAEVKQRKAKTDALGRRERDTGSQPPLVLNAARERSEHTGARLQQLATRRAGQAHDRLNAAKERIDERTPLKIVLPPTGLHATALVLSARALSVTLPRQTAPLFTVSFDVRGAQRVAVVGRNGSGKSTLLRVLTGEREPTSGALYHGIAIDRFAMLDQHADRMGGELSVLQAFTLSHPLIPEGSARQLLAQFHFFGDAVYRKLSAVSGGERVRATLARVLGGNTPPQCLLLDEPTNHLDLDSVQQLETALRDYDGAIVVVSHDERFLDALGVETRMSLD